MRKVDTALIWIGYPSCTNLMFHILGEMASHGLHDSVTPSPKYAGLTWLLFLLKHTYLSGVWLGVDVWTDTKNMCNKRDWIRSLIFVNYSRQNIQHNLRDL
jgi:hypothetical protein